ncbi:MULTISPECIES: hypothetical protein [unclassified Psychrobacter]|uniref:hypothetical protein n=1 Tax=unclassified Psychrobacter TaxID=196806 RepID=UPI003FD0F832
MLDRPWIKDNDPIKDFYDCLNKEEIAWLYGVVKAVDLNRATFNTNFCPNKVQLLDFSNYYDNPYQFDLLSDLINEFNYIGSSLFWLPLNNDCSKNEFEKFEPLMIAKTPMNIIYLKKVSRSMMQMMNGGYIVVDSGNNFIAIIVDGYYMLALVDDDNLPTKYEKYIKNWSLIEENIDSITAKPLIRARL